MASRVSLRDWPRLTRFYGIPPSALARMPHALLRLYADALMELTAEEALHGFLTADMPYAEKGDRQRIHREYARYLPAGPKEEAPDPRSEEGKALAASHGIKIDLPAEVKSEESANA